MNSPWQCSLLCFCFGDGEWLRPPWDTAVFHCPREAAAKLLSPVHQCAETTVLKPCALQLQEAELSPSLPPCWSNILLCSSLVSRGYQGGKGKGRRQMLFVSLPPMPPFRVVISCFMASWEWASGASKLPFLVTVYGSY